MSNPCVCISNDILPARATLWAGDELISEPLIRTIGEVLPQTMPYAEAVETIKKKGIASADTVIKKLGYAVKWSGLDPADAMVYKTK